MKRILATAAALCLLYGGAAEAALTPNSVILAQTPNRGVLQLSANPGTYGTLYTAGANGSKCVSLSSTNSDALSTHLLTVQVVNAGVQYGGVAITSTVSAGFAGGTPPQALLASSVWAGLPLDSDGNPFLMLVSGDTLQATYATALSAGVINFYAVCYDF